MADQHVLLLSGVVLILVVQLSAGSDCSEESMQEMQIQFNDCAAGLGNQFVDTRNTFHGMEYIQESVCILFSKTVEKCGKVWKKCHTKDEIHDLKDMHLESLLSQYRDIKLDHCPVVKEYIKSGRRKKIDQQVKRCDDVTSAGAQEKFQACSQSSSTLAYQKIMDVKEKNLIKTILCDTLKNISNICSKELEECFSDEDLVMMTTSHLKEMQKFLARITRGKFKMEELEDCEIYENKQEITTEIDSSQVEAQDDEKEKEMFTEKNINPDLFHGKNSNIDGKREKNELHTNKTYLAKPDIDIDYSQIEAQEVEKEEEKEIFTEKNNIPNIIEGKDAIIVGKHPSIEKTEFHTNNTNLVKPEEILQGKDPMLVGKHPSIEKTEFHTNNTNLVKPEEILQAAYKTESKGSSAVSCIFITFLFPISFAYICNMNY